MSGGIDYARPGVGVGYAGNSDNLKTVYGRPIDLLDKDLSLFTKRLRKMKMSDGGGDTFQELVITQGPGGTTLSRAQSGIQAMRAPKEGQSRAVSIRPANYHKTVVVSNEYRADARGDATSFLEGTKHAVTQGVNRAGIEIEALYVFGQSPFGLGVAESTVSSWSSGATKSFPLKPAYYVPGLWPNVIGLEVDVWNSTFTTKRNSEPIYAYSRTYSTTTPSITLATASGAAVASIITFAENDVIVMAGAGQLDDSTFVYNEIQGLYKALSTTAGVLNGLDNTNLPLYQPNVQALNGPISIRGLRDAILQQEDEGNIGPGDEVEFFAGARHMKALNDEYSLLMRTAKADAQKMGEYGHNGLSIFGNNIIVKCTTAPIMYWSVGMILSMNKEHFCKVGPKELHWEELTPDGGAYAPLFPEFTGFGGRLWDKTAPYVRHPVKHTLLTGLDIP